MADPTILTDRDLQSLNARDLSQDDFDRQLAQFRHGIQPCRLERPCTLHDGIATIAPEVSSRYLDAYRTAVEQGRVSKFVPASGAGTRMFRELLSLSSTGVGASRESLASQSREDRDARSVLLFFQRFYEFALRHQISAAMGASRLAECLSEGRYQPVLDVMLSEACLNLANRPKGLLPFHDYGDYYRTPIEEHLSEAVSYVRDLDGVARVHFTVTPEHEIDISAHIRSVCGGSIANTANMDVTLSAQKPSSETVTLAPDYTPVRDVTGQIVFRPSGHGALIENLQDLRGDIVLIKNIDNISVEQNLKEVSRYKRLLGGMLVVVQNQVFEALRNLKKAETRHEVLSEAARIATDLLGHAIPEGRKNGDPARFCEYLFHLLNRPLRVCGMVRNQGDPGGGPFWVHDKDGNVRPQIIESAQVDPDDPTQQRIWSSSSHFNPVDLACGVRDYQGTGFPLADFVDPDTAFITTKSWEGRPVLAMERPGLWNGSMAGWNTIFVEIPSTMFNPVKTITDLLKPAHMIPDTSPMPS